MGLSFSRIFLVLSSLGSLLLPQQVWAQNTLILSHGSSLKVSLNIPGLEVLEDFPPLELNVESDGVVSFQGNSVGSYVDGLLHVRLKSEANEVLELKLQSLDESRFSASWKLSHQGRVLSQVSLVEF